VHPVVKKFSLTFVIIFSLLFNIFTIQTFAVTTVDETNTSAYDSITVQKIMDKTSLFDLTAKGAVLIDASTGKVLFEKDSHQKLPIASVTKVMSMLLIMEALDSGKIRLDDKVTVSEHSFDMGGSQVWLKPGEEFAVSDMLNAVAIHSANDATVALAEKVSGSEEVFVAAMNEKAKELGMNDTNFLDCTGLTDDGHYSSANDIALMSKELIMKHPKIIDFTTTWHTLFRENDPAHTVALDNTNKLIHFYQGANGLKTGFTTKAGYCLASAAKRNNFQLIAVVLGEADSNTRFAESRKLLDYGFANYEITQVDNKGTEIGNVSVKKGVQKQVKGIYSDDVKLLVNKGEKGKLDKEVKLTPDLTAPIKQGQKVGEVIYKMNGNEVGKAEIIAESKVDRASFIRLFFRMILGWVGIGK
jgi:serine-type D-Ala-D-Ala carboxypeptidase (penicillin-binding protein 5/6)